MLAAAGAAIGAAVVGIAAFCTAMSTGVPLLSAVIGLFVYGAGGAVIGGGMGAVCGAMLGSVMGLFVPKQRMACAPGGPPSNGMNNTASTPQPDRAAGVVPGNTPGMPGRAQYAGR